MIGQAGAFSMAGVPPRSLFVALFYPLARFCYTGISSTGSDSMFRRMSLVLAALAALMIVAAPTVAQCETQKTWEKKKKNTGTVTTPAPTVPPPIVKSGPSAVKAAPQAATCVPSGFGRLSRNCSANTGNCQPMKEQCNLGWCCP
jgi:formate hydrogenlyase subunit 3/multisubunit Na+/H+ antiporter MnhD subunit